MSQTQRKRGRVSTNFQNRLPNISLLLLSPANGWWGPPSLIPSSPPVSPILQLHLFVASNNGESCHHGCKMFQFSFQQAFTSFFVCVLYVCVQLKGPFCSNLSWWGQTITESVSGIHLGFVSVGEAIITWLWMWLDRRSRQQVFWTFPFSQTEILLLQKLETIVCMRLYLSVCTRFLFMLCDFVHQCMWEHLFEEPIHDLWPPVT